MLPYAGRVPAVRWEPVSRVVRDCGTCSAPSIPEVAGIATEFPRRRGVRSPSATELARLERYSTMLLKNDIGMTQQGEANKFAYPAMMLAFFNLRARFLLWLSSYLSVSSTISSDIISSMISEKCSCQACTWNNNLYTPSRVTTPIAPPSLPGVSLISKRCARPVWLRHNQRQETVRQ